MIEILTLCSSKELQDSVQESNPVMDIHSEIIKKWKENYLLNDNDFKNYFSNDELSLLDYFDKWTNDKNGIEMENLSEKIIEKLDKE